MNDRMLPLDGRAGQSSAAPDGVAASTALVDETIDLAVLFEPHVDVVALRRRGHAALAAYCARVARDLPLAFKASMAFAEAGGLDPLDDLARALPADDARDVLIEDLAYWIEVMTELTGSARVGVRLARLEAPMCPAFHVDHVTVRLVCTYARAPTEWLDARDVERRQFVAGPNHRRLELHLRPDAAVQRAAPLDVLLLKGSAWENDHTRGAVHRSPPHSGARLLLSIDPLG